MASGTIKQPGLALLWTNPSPTSNFAAQTITLAQSADNFDALAVQVKTNGGIIYVAKDDYNNAQLFAPGYIAVSGFYAFRMRTVAVSGTSVSFQDNYEIIDQGNTNTRAMRNDLCQPLKIWGVHF